MAQPDVRIQPLPEGEVSKFGQKNIVVKRERELSEEVSKILAQNQKAFEKKKFNVFGDRKMLEVVYRHFVEYTADGQEFDVATVAAELDESEAKVKVAFEVFKSILGEPDDRPSGGAAGGLDEYEVTDMRKAA